ncbi:MAG: glycoside hydrolase family 3 C-terminal domain-containing protein [Blautia obeum]
MNITASGEENRQFGKLAESYDFTVQEDDIDPQKSYLELSNREEKMVDKVAKEFENVIVVINSSNTMELGWLEKYDNIKAALVVSGPGEVGFQALGKILKGDVNPSGHLTDTYVYDLYNTQSAKIMAVYDNYAKYRWRKIFPCL